MSIILKDLDNNIIENCDLEDDFINIMMINKYYCKIISNNKLFVEWKSFYCETKKSRHRMRSMNFIFGYSCAYNFLCFSKYLFKKYYSPDLPAGSGSAEKYLYSINIHADNEYAFRESCRNGHLEMAKWLIGLKLIIKINIHAGYKNSDNEYAFRWACINGHLAVAKWLVELSKKTEYGLINIHERVVPLSNTGDIFRNTCENGQLEVAKWLLELSKEKEFGIIDINSHKELNFIITCSTGHLDVAKWLLELYKNYGLEFNNTRQIYSYTNHVYEEAFLGCCENGNLDVAKWLIELSREKDSNSILGLINIHVENEYAFRCSCQNGYINVAKWLIELSYKPEFGLIDIHVYKEEAFRLSCVHGRFIVAKWLIELSYQSEFGLINIHAEKEHAFRSSCRHGQIEIVKWLINLSYKPEFGLIDIRAKDNEVFNFNIDPEIKKLIGLIDYYIKK